MQRPDQDDPMDVEATGVADTEPPPASAAREKKTRRPTLLGGFQPPPVAPVNEATLRAAGLSWRPIRSPR